MKRFLIALLCVTVSAVAFAACGSSAKPVDFENQTVNASVGDIFEVTDEMLDVKAADGNVYRATYNVTSSDGKKITPIYNRFDVLNGKTYTIEITVVIRGKTYTRSVTVSSEDTEKPVISFTQAEKTGITGREYRYPRASVSDNSGEASVTDKKIYFVNGEAREVVADVGENSFTPAKGGKYVYSLTAADGNGNTETNEYEFFIRDLERTGEIESFNHGLSIGSVTGGAYDKLEYLEEYQGRKGVIKFTYGSQEWPYLTVLPRQAKEYYEGAKYVVFNMRFESNGNPVLVNCYGDAQSQANGWKINLPAVENEWREYRYDARVFLKFFDDFSENRLVWYATGGKDKPGVVYIDDICCIWEAEISIENESCRLKDVPADGMALSAVSTEYGGEYVYTVKEVNAQGVAIGENLAEGGKFLPTKSGNYTITATPADNSYTSTATKTITIKEDKEIILSGDLPSQSAAGTAITVPSGSVTDGESTLGDEVLFTATYNGSTVTVTGGTVTPQYSGELVLTYSAEGCVTVIKEIVITRNPTVAAGEVESFNDPAALSESVITNGQTDWLESYAGENGVLKITFKDNGGSDENWFYLALKARSENVDFYAGDELVLRMYFAADNEFDNDINCYGDSGALAAGIRDNNPLTRGVWRNYVYNAEVLRRFFGNTAENRMIWHSNHVMNNDAVVYVADVYVRQSPARAANVVEDYADAASVDRSFTSEYEKIEWLETFQGRNGVMKITYKDNDWPYLYVAARHAAASYSGYGDIVFRMWIDDESNPLQVNKYGNDNDYGQDYPAERGKWVEYTYNADIFRAQPDNPNYNRMVWYTSNKTAEGYIYIDEIYMVRSAAAADEVESFDDALSLNRVFAADCTKEWLESYDGENGVLKLTFSADLAEQWPYLCIMYRRKLSDYSGKTKVVYRMRIEDPSYLVEVNKYGNGSTNDLQINPDRGKWVDYEYNIAPLTEGGTNRAVNRLFWNRKGLSEAKDPVVIYISSVTVR